ncbi:NADH-quinone oxidoreductase subunit J [Chitinophagaceae bacterium LB-8]|uniref:NADH-quinone oxidoreductase subunit J n=1 Tax=Paraflavisolibacter caeni TaxID=2982496 RepID=A0A9X2XY08_9BACT|nr:NADH-quinone oxidoreductase subunit J [Paraflavisolibacter caeni]MCU7550870.1 NADH-quinone oxidoreductase subunit J [Paraflavisolibacter caeni]
MNGSTIIFYLLAALTLGCGMVAVTTRQIFRAAIFLLFSLIGIAGIYFWLDYEFIAAVQVVVYVGGIVVLIIFSIFLTHQAGEQLPKQSLRRKLLSVLASVCGFLLTIIQVWKYSFTKSAGTPVEPSVGNIGRRLLSANADGYALPFEVISMLLLAAMVGCIVIAMKSPTAVVSKENKAQPEMVTIDQKEQKILVEEEIGEV